MKFGNSSGLIFKPQDCQKAFLHKKVFSKGGCFFTLVNFLVKSSFLLVLPFTAIRKVGSEEKQVSTNTGPRYAARYRNQFSQQYYLWLCSSVDQFLAVDLKNPGSIPSQGDFVSLKFILKRK